MRDRARACIGVAARARSAAAEVARAEHAGGVPVLLAAEWVSGADRSAARGIVARRCRMGNEASACAGGPAEAADEVGGIGARGIPRDCAAGGISSADQGAARGICAAGSRVRDEARPKGASGALPRGGCHGGNRKPHCGHDLEATLPHGHISIPSGAARAKRRMKKPPGTGRGA